MDALGAFSYLLDNLPSWIHQVSDLIAHAAAKHAEYIAAYKKLTHVKLRRRKNSSVCSICTAENIHRIPKDTAAPERSSGLNPNRKRQINAISSDSSNNSTHSDVTVVSMRHNVVIHYDGHTQQVFEELVRFLSAARNNLRHGKISHISRTNFGQGASFRRAMELRSKLLNSGSGDRTMTGVGATPNPATPKQSAFDLVEKQIESVHSLCETAAHQFLRYGDCVSVLESIHEKLRSLLEMATREADRLKDERQQQETLRSAEPATTMKTGSLTASPPKSSSFGMIEIEVDDAVSVSSVPSMDLAAFRATRRLRV